jgi:N-methylhydantoinase B
VPRSFVDPISTEVIRYELVAAAEEMKQIFKRSTMSMTLYELNDFGMSLFDEEFNMLADAPGLCLFTGSLGDVTRACARRIGVDAFRSGDVILTTFPFDLGSQAADAAVVAPIFLSGQLVGYASVKAHFGEFGGIDPYPTSSTDMFQEGLLLPPVHLYRRGRPNEELLRIIAANSRMPTSTIGNLHAGASAIFAGGKRLADIVARHGCEQFRASVQEIFDHGERVARRAISEIPDGRWVVEDYMDDNGVGQDPVKISMEVVVEGSDLMIDLSRSSPQQEGPVNCPLPGAVSACRYAIKALTAPLAPANEGYFRPLHVRADEGTLFNPAPPAPTFIGLFAALRLVDLLPLALAEVVPERATASSGSDISAVLMFYLDPENDLPEVVGGAEPLGLGALATRDGQNALVHHSEAGCTTIPVEVIESRAPMLVERFEIRGDSGGPGAYRGGLGITKVYRTLEDCLAISVMDRVKGAAPRGLQGGGEGRTGKVVYFPGTPDELTTGRRRQQMPAGSRVVQHSHGGGGFGDPFARDAEAVLADVRDGYVSVEGARDDYGVAIERNGADDYRIALAATMKLRATRGTTSAAMAAVAT